MMTYIIAVCSLVGCNPSILAQGMAAILVRIAFIILFLGYGSGLLVYILLWLLAPKSPMP